MTQNLKTVDDTPLEKLKDSGLQLDDIRDDIRGRKVVDQTGKTIGHVSALFIDEPARKVRMLDIAGGGFLGIGDQHFLLPVDAITKIGKAGVSVRETSERIAQSPVYDPKLVVAYDRDYWAPYYGYYGVEPYWNDGYRDPEYPRG